tara:strand:- start:1552 stop:2064 length:513 start_codon:yes stop_codon:yes gene_type:complete
MIKVFIEATDAAGSIGDYWAEPGSVHPNDWLDQTNDATKAMVELSSLTFQVFLRSMPDEDEEERKVFAAPDRLADMPEATRERLYQLSDQAYNEYEAIITSAGNEEHVERFYEEAQTSTVDYAQTQWDELISLLERALDQDFIFDRTELAPLAHIIDEMIDIMRYEPHVN